MITANELIFRDMIELAERLLKVTNKWQTITDATGITKEQFEAHKQKLEKNRVNKF